MPRTKREIAPAPAHKAPKEKPRIKARAPARRPADKNLVDRLTGDVVSAWVPRALFDDAAAIVARGRVARPRIGGELIKGVVADEEVGQVRVRLGWGIGKPASVCDCGRVPGPCVHAAALAFLVAGVSSRGPSDADADDDLDEEKDSTKRPPTPMEAERARREERGQSELFSVTGAAGTQLYGSYEVGSPSSRTYEVTVRALDARHNGCNCPDLATNQLGTCKHIEAVLHRLRKEAPRRFAAAAREGVPRSYVHLEWSDENVEPRARVRLSPRASVGERRFAARWFASGGLDATALSARFTELRQGAIEAGVELGGDVAALGERLRGAEERDRRWREVEAEVRAAGPEQPGFRGTLYAYQVEGVAFLAGRGRALLADDMGLGKTAQAITAMVRLRRRGEARRVLIVCPASLKHQWKREIERFTGIGTGTEADLLAVVAGSRETRTATYEGPAEILIANYEVCRTDEPLLTEWAPDLVILDEAQRIKNWRTLTSSVVKRIPSRFAFVLTGTPLENRLDDLYSLMQVIDPHLFGPLWRFNQDFSALDDKGRVKGYRHLDRLRARVTGVMLRRKKEEVLKQLPGRLVNRMTVPLTPPQRDIHDEAEATVARLLAILKRRALTPQEEQRLMRAFQRMRMACNAAGLCDGKTAGAPKLDELAGLLDEICVQGGRKVVVFSEWEKMQQMAAEVCKELKIEHVRLHGGVPSGSRGALIERFLGDPNCRVFLSTDAGGVGLNLQAASHVINLDLPWNPAVLAQRIARVHRLGQTEAVNVVMLVSEESFEERIERTLDAKRALFAAAVGDDTETTELERSTLASRLASLLSSEFAADTGRAPAPPPEAAAPEAPPVDPVEALRERFGDTLERVVRLADGRLLAVVRGEAPPSVGGGTPDAAMQQSGPQAAAPTAATSPMATGSGAAEPGAAPRPAAEMPLVVLPSRAVEALAPLGAASPLAASELLFQAAAQSERAAQRAIRRARLDAAERKFRGAKALIAAELPGEALGLLQGALALACRALDERGDPGDDPAALLAAVYGHLVPTGVLSAEDAHALSRAGELSRAFAGSAHAPPAALVEDIEREARELLARARERLV